MDAVLRKLITIPNVALATIAEFWILSRYQIAESNTSLDERKGLLWNFLRLAFFNAFLLALYGGLIYPYFVSELRRFPTSRNRRARMFHWASLGGEGPGQVLSQWANEAPSEDGVMALRSPFLRSRLVIFGPKALQEILVTQPYNFVKPPHVASFLRYVLGDGLVLTEGDLHRFQRKNAQPAFSFRHIKDLYPMMWKKALAVSEIIGDRIKESGSTGELEITHYADKATLDVIGIAGLGRELHALQNVQSPLLEGYEELLRPDTKKLVLFMSMVFGPQKLLMKMPWNEKDKFLKTTAALRSETRRLVMEKREAIKIGADQHFDILSLLIQTGNFSDSDLTDHLLTFLAAGHETTTATFSWTMFLLSTRRELQTRLREEIRSSLPADPLATTEGGEDLATTLERLPLLNAIISETLRIYPTVPMTARRAIQDTTLVGHPIPKGTDMFISPWATNRHPAIWGPDAEEFKPERWINADGTSNNSGGIKTNYGFITFLHGPRSCIGQGFARTELRCLLAAIVGRFEFELAMKVEDVQPLGVITIKPSKGLHLKMKEVGTWEGVDDGIVLKE